MRLADVGPVHSSASTVGWFGIGIMDAAGVALPRGVNDLSFEDDKDDGHRRKSPQLPDSEKPAKPRAKKKSSETPEVGLALRTVYDRTVNEAIPAEMLDLLGKLD